MRGIEYVRPQGLQEIINAAADWSQADHDVRGLEAAQYLAGGTTLLDLAKLDVMRPVRMVDLSGMKEQWGRIELAGDTLKLGALATMAALADHADVQRRAPVLTQSLQLAASAQLRNMATLGGNVLQRTRCAYFRDTSYAACNKRRPGSGCAALDGKNRLLAVLGVSDQCIASYAGDFGQALIALDALVQVQGREGERTLPFADLHTQPGTTPYIETTLKPSEIITGFEIPLKPWYGRSRYVKVRDRQSYAFALASAAVALDMEGTTVRAARLALGGMATVPWRAHQAEAFLVGKTLDEATALDAGRIALDGAVTHDDNDYKPELGQQTVARALLETASLAMNGKEG